MLSRAGSLLVICGLLMLGAWSYAHAWPAHGLPTGSPPPVIANASFSFQTPATTGATVGTLSASGSPTSWAITAGDPLGGFAINSSGVITITTGSIFGVTGGTETLTVSATNAFGTSSNPNIIITWVPSGSPPVVNTASFSFTAPTTNGASVGTLTASGSPTSWAITAGNPGSGTGFAISNAGVITIGTASVFGSTSGSTTLTVTATNTFGTGTNSNIIISWTASGGVPVIANASFTFTTPTTNGAAIGTLSATGSPTSWFITAGNTICGFIIDNFGNITITTGSLFGSGSGSETLTVTAVNSFGTGTNSNIIITWAPSGTAPVITSASFSITTPVSSGGNVGTLSATGSPTSWAITAGDTSHNFAISNSGVITTTAAAVTNLGSNSGSQTLTVTATNASGTGTNSNIIINYAPFNPGSCSNTTVANLPLGAFTPALQNNGSVVTNSDSTAGWTATNFSVIESNFNAPADCIYTFTVNAFAGNNPGVTNANTVMVYMDGQPIQATGATLTNYFVQLVTNCCAGPATGYQFSHPVKAGVHNVVVGFNLAQNATLVNTTQIVHGDRLIVAQTATPMQAEPAGSRNPWNFPFSSYSFFNTAIGTGAIWSSGTTNADLSLQAGHNTNVNYNSFNSAYIQSTPSDALGRFNNTSVTFPNMDYNGTNPHQLHISASQCAAINGGTCVAPGTDFSGVFGDTTNIRYTYTGSNNTSYNAGPPPVILGGAYGGIVDNYEQNAAIGASSQVPGGYIRVADITSGVIAHTLELGTQYSQMLLPPSSVQGLGWPVAIADYVCSAGSPTDCTGAMQWGSTIGIPSVVKGGPNCNNLGLPTPYGVMLCVALQNYGAVHSINSGNANTPVNTLIGEYAPTNSTFQTAMGQISTAWGALQSNLRIMTNNLPSLFYTGDGVQSCAATGCAKGGGTPLVAMLPGVQSGLAAINPAPAPPATQSPFKIANMSYNNNNGSCLTTNAAVNPGSSVFILVTQAGTGLFNGVFTGATDNGTGGSNTYSVAVQQTNSAVATPAIMYSLNIQHALPVGSQLCINGPQFWSGNAWAATGVNGGIDKTASQANASSHGFSFTSPTLSQNNELVLFFFAPQTQIGASTNPIVEGLSGVEMQDGIFTGATYQVQTTGGTVTYSPSWPGNASATQAIMATFKIP